MKKLLTLFVAGLMGVSLVGCGSGDSKKDTLVVAAVEMNGDFIEGFGNSSYDLEIKNVLHNYYITYDNDAEGNFVTNKTILDGEPVATKNADGSKTYTFKIKKGLKWSNGSDLTAKDFVFNILLGASDEWVAALAAETTGEGLVGYAKYHAGLSSQEEGGVADIVYKRETDKKIQKANAADNEVKVSDMYDKDGYELDSEGKRIPLLGFKTDENGDPLYDANGELVPEYREKKGDNGTFEGVQLNGDYEFSTTIAADKLPYFFEKNYVAFYPKPMTYLAGKDAKIESSEKGATLVGVDLDDVAQKTKSEYRINPKVTSGPYKLVSFKNKQVKLTKNKYFKGDYEGHKPSIPNILVKTVNQKTDMDQLLAGEVDVLTGVVEGKKIEKAKKNSSVKASSYARNGYGNVPIHNDFGATKEPAVRRALNYILDKDNIIQTVLGGYGSTVYGDYGTAQWMYQENKEAVEGELNHYTYNIESANKELDSTEWKFEADGVTPWDAAKAEKSKDYYRYNAQKQPLTINHLGTDDNTVTDALETEFLKNSPKVGIKFSIERTDFAGLMDNYYNAAQKPESQRKYNTFNMATGFTPVYDPWSQGSFASIYAGTSLNPTNTRDAELDKLMQDMRNLEPEQHEEFSKAWLAFQKRFNEIVPEIPVYANEYFDFYNADLKGFKTGPMSSWSEIICNVSWAE